MNEQLTGLSVRTRLLKGVFWSAVEKYSSQISSILVSMVLTRLLSPKEFGIVAIATIILNFLSIFSTMGLGPAIIQRKDLEQPDYNSIFSFSLYLGLGLFILLFMSAGLIANYYGNGQLVNIVRIISVNVFLVAVNVVPNALMYKNQRFKEIAKRTLVIQVITGPISIAAAYLGCGAYSLLISPVATAIFIFVYNIHIYPCAFKIRFSFKAVRKIISYSTFQFLFEVSNYFSRNLDKLIIGKTLSQTDLGYYDKSYRLMQLPLNNVSSVLGPVIQPVFSYLQDDKEQLAEKYNRIIKLLATIGFPLGVFLAYSGYEIIYILFGQQWLAAVSSFGILAYSIPIQLMLGTSGSIFQSASATKNLFLAGLRNTLIVVIGFVIAAVNFKTIESFAIAWTICEVIVFFSSYIDLYCFVLKSSLWKMMKVLLYPILYGIVLLLVFYFIRFPDNALMSLLLKALITIVVTLCLIQLFHQYEIIGMARKYFKKSKHNNDSSDT